MLEANAPQAQKQQQQALEHLNAAHSELRKKADEAEIIEVTRESSPVRPTGPKAVKKTNGAKKARKKGK